jgi:hypothetical protein
LPKAYSKAITYSRLQPLVPYMRLTQKCAVALDSVSLDERVSILLESSELHAFGSNDPWHTRLATELL